MNEIANTNTKAPSVLDSLAMQAQMFAQNAAMNLLQLGRVLTEARPLIPHGQFDAWCKQHAKMSKRTAEQYMQAYANFGLDARIAELGTTKIIKLLPMTEDEREKLLADNDVSSMTTRQLDAAIREQREKLREEAMEEARDAIIEAEREAEEAREAMIEAQKRAEEAENRPPQVPERLTQELVQNRETIQAQQAEIARLADVGRTALNEKQRLVQENANLRRDLKERDEDMEAMQADFDRAQEELLNLQSAQARGDAEHKPADVLTPDVFTAAVNGFVGTCCRLPQMGRVFSAMSEADREQYNQSLRVLEDWIKGARQAMNTIEYGEAIFVG